MSKNQQEQSASLSSKERKESSILISDSDAGVRKTMRQSLISLGFGSVYDVASHSTALERFEDNNFNYVIFDSKNGDIPSKEFLDSVLTLDRHCIAIASSYDPSIDDVFELLIMGAQGFLLKPFSSQALDESIRMATRGEPIADVVRAARTRNEALAALALSALDKLANIIKQSRTFETAKLEIEPRALAFRRAVEMGKTFARGEEKGFRDSVIAFALDRAEGPRASVSRAKTRAKAKNSEKEKGPSLSNLI